MKLNYDSSKTSLTSKVDMQCIHRNCSIKKKEKARKLVIIMAPYICCTGAHKTFLSLMQISHNHTICNTKYKWKTKRK